MATKQAVEVSYEILLCIYTCVSECYSTLILLSFKLNSYTGKLNINSTTNDPMNMKGEKYQSGHLNIRGGKHFFHNISMYRGTPEAGLSLSMVSLFCV